MNRRLLLLALPVLSACANWADDVAGPSAKTLTAPVAAAQGSLADRYIVVFRDDVQNPGALADALVAQSGGTVHFRYAHAIKGFAATLPAAALDGISRNPNVAYIEPDGIVSTTDTQSNATWGLDRIDQRDLPLSGTYTYNQTGAGVTVYIIDTGIRTSHNEFGGRASFGFDALGGNGDDCNGHGTHVAGTVGGTVYGVAKSVTLKAVRVLNCQGSGTNSGVIAGVDWVTANHVSPAPAVANMSLGGGANSSLDDAVNNAVADGVVFAVAAGNETTDACTRSPARAASALTVGSTTSTDARSSFSNFGTCLDIFAPGSSITSAWISNTSNSATNTISGTSMASPHVAGAAALYLQTNPTASATTANSAIVNNATTGKVTNAGSGSVNRLLYSVFGSSGGTNSPPTSSFTFSCTDLTCSFNGSGSSDSDGTVASYAWNFGDGTSGSGATINKTYASGGTRTVILTVTDDDNATGMSSQPVTVTSPSEGGITLVATGTKDKGLRTANLTWTGASGANVDIYRNSTIITTANDGAHTDAAGKGGSITYKVCNAGTSTCSNSVSLF